MNSRQKALAASALASFFVPFMMSAVGIALPTIQNSLGATAVELSWVVGSYMLTLAATALPVGRIADIYGRKRLFAWGAAWFTLTTLLVSLSWSITMLLGMRVLQGIGAAMINATGLPIVTTLYPVEERGRAMGVIVGCVYAGLAVGPLVGGVLTDLVGWRWIFLLSLPPGIFVCFLICRIEGEWQPAQGERFDLWAAMLYALFVLCFMQGLTGLIHPVRGGLFLVLSGVFGWGFWRRVAPSPSPLLRLALFSRNRVFLLTSLATMFNYTATFAVGFLLSLYLQVVKGFTPAHAGLILVLQPVVQAALSPLAGVFSDKYSASAMASLGMMLCTLGLVGLSFVQAFSPVWHVGGLLTLLGLGFALFASPNMSVAMGSVRKREYSIAASLITTMRTFGMSLSMGLAAVAFGFFLAGEPVSTKTVPEFLLSMRILFLSCAALCFVGVICSLVRKKSVL